MPDNLLDGDLIQYRLEQAGSALNDARTLLESSGSAGGVINRSYYAMFYAVLALLQNIGEVPRKHSGVISLFDREFYKTGLFPKQLSKDLHKAFDLRQQSDCRDLIMIDREVAEEVLRSAGAFVEAVATYLARDKRD